MLWGWTVSARAERAPGDPIGSPGLVTAPARPGLGQTSPRPLYYGTGWEHVSSRWRRDHPIGLDAASRPLLLLRLLRGIGADQLGQFRSYHRIPAGRRVLVPHRCAWRRVAEPGHQLGQCGAGGRCEDCPGVAQVVESRTARNRAHPGRHDRGHAKVGRRPPRRGCPPAPGGRARRPPGAVHAAGAGRASVRLQDRRHAANGDAVPVVLPGAGSGRSAGPAIRLRVIGARYVGNRGEFKGYSCPLASIRGTGYCLLCPQFRACFGRSKQVSAGPLITGSIPVSPTITHGIAAGQPVYG